MLKKTITYEDYNGVERTEDFFFNLTKSEISEMEISTEGGLVSKIQKMMSLLDGEKIMALFKSLLLKSYGEKSDDGRHFVKSEALSIAFSQTPAYDILFYELVTNPEKAAEFFNAVVPAVEKK